jgi:hypothetical protein
LATVFADFGNKTWLKDLDKPRQQYKVTPKSM